MDFLAIKMSGAVNPNTPHSPPVYTMFNKITQYLTFFMCHHNDISVIMVISSSKFCSIPWRGRFKSWLRPWDVRRSWMLYDQRVIISILDKKKSWNICFIKWHQHQTRSEEIKANKTQQISVKTKVFFCKNWTKT